jgi:hypothetical protein
VFITFAVAAILIVTGRGPQSKRITPPARTAATTAAEVQLAGVPRPTTRERAAAAGCAEAGITDAHAASAHITPVKATARRATPQA